MATKSRLSRNFQKKSRNTLVVSILAIIAILFLLFRYGIPLISDTSFLFGRITSNKKNNIKNTTDKESFVPIPELDLLPKATKDNHVKITGTSLSGLSVEIYLNGNKTDEAIAENDGNFVSNIELTEGENIIKVRATKNGAKSDFSDSESVSFQKKAPDLSIDSPNDGSQIHGGNPIEVKGKTDSDASVLVNDFQAINNSNGEWSYILTVKDGGNEIKVSSTDLAGNKTEKVIHINYSQ